MFDAKKKFGISKDADRGDLYMQDGKYYTMQYKPCDESGCLLEEEEVKPVTILAGVDYEKMSAADIKKHVVAAGGEYTNKTNGIAFLRGE